MLTVFCRCQRTALVDGDQKNHCFFLDGVNAQLAMFLGVLLRDNKLMLAFRSSRCNIYNRLATGLSVMFMFHFGKGVTVFNFLRFLSSCLFSCRGWRLTHSLGWPA